MARACNPDYVNAEWAFYRFEPSTAAAIFFCVVFILTTALHLFQMVRTKTWYLTAFVIGGFFELASELIGYAARAKNTMEDPGCWTLGPYIIQNVLLLIAPALMAASIYMILGRIIMLTDGESHALIKRRWLTKVFVSGDVLSLLLQSSGGGMMAAAGEGNNFMEIGEKTIIVGLFVQLFVFGFFIVTAALFHRRMALVPTAKSHQPEIRWKYYLLTLYVTSVLIWVRSVFRVIEYLQGNKGELMTTEVYIYIFDATLMFLVMVWMNWFHPSEIGLLLRGEPPIKNGLELMKIGGNFRKMQHENSSMSV